MAKKEVKNYRYEQELLDRIRAEEFATRNDKPSWKEGESSERIRNSEAIARQRDIQNAQSRKDREREALLLKESQRRMKKGR